MDLCHVWKVHLEAKTGTMLLKWILHRVGPLKSAQSEYARKLRESKNVQLTAGECLGVFHISSAAKQAIAEEQQRSRFVPKYVSRSETAREREKEISETDDLPAPHDLPPSACHSQSLSHSLFFSPRSLCFTHTHQLTGGADILGGVIPGVESLRSPCCDPVILGRGRVLEACRERKRLYIKTTFRPEAVSLQLYGYK